VAGREGNPAFLYAIVTIMNPFLLRQLILPAWQRLNRQNSLKVLSYLESTQWLAPEELFDLQWQRIRALLEHAYENVPYYRDIMRAAGNDPASVCRLRSLAMLPLLDRSTISRDRNRLRATNIPADRFIPNGTGGSTGEPLRFFDDRAGAGWSNAAVWRSQRWLGVDVGDRCTYLWGANFDLSAYQGFSGSLRSRILNIQMLPAWELSEGTAVEFWQKVVHFRPRLLLAYAGAIYEWARLLGNHRDPIPGLTAIIVSAEILYNEWRSVIEDCFKVPVYNRYGGRDIDLVAQECPARKGLHINSEKVFLEIVRDGSPVPAGGLGEIVITRLDNFAMPFIRYRCGDLGVMADYPCECGRALPLLQKVEGRVQDAIVTGGGKIVSGPFFAHMMKDCPDVKEFQIHQLAVDRLLILLVLHAAQPFTSHTRIERIIQQYMGPDMQIEFEIRDAIPRTPSGKRRVTVSHLQRWEPKREETGASLA
jgi:phenylacetate-CoA ligase